MIYMDRIQNVDLLTFCLAIGYQRYNMAKGLHSKVVVYGGALVTDQDAHNAIQHAIDNGGSFAATNSSLRCDPWQGMTKSCAVFYERDGIIKGVGRRKTLGSTSSWTSSPSPTVPGRSATRPCICAC